jgi:hypothetical protein
VIAAVFSGLATVRLTSVGAMSTCEVTARPGCVGRSCEPLVGRQHIVLGKLARPEIALWIGQDEDHVVGSARAPCCCGAARSGGCSGCAATDQACAGRHRARADGFQRVPASEVDRGSCADGFIARVSLQAISPTAALEHGDASRERLRAAGTAAWCTLSKIWSFGMTRIVRLNPGRGTPHSRIKRGPCRGTSGHRP